MRKYILTGLLFISLASFGQSPMNLLKIKHASSPYVTWFFIDTDLEQYNANQGIRKKAGVGDAWGKLSWSNQTVGSGESVTVVVDGNTHYKIIGLNPTRTGDAVNTAWTYAFYLLAGGTFQVLDASGGSSPAGSYVSGDWIRVRDTGSSVVYEQSTNAGSSWSTIHTAATTPSGNYYIGVTIYTAGGGFSQVFK